MKKKDRTTPRPFTKYQREEIEYLILVRKDTIESDPESADDFETQENLDALSAKVKANSLASEYTEAEKEWMLEELEFHLMKAEGGDPDEQPSRRAFARSITNAINKLA